MTAILGEEHDQGIEQFLWNALKVRGGRGGGKRGYAWMLANATTLANYSILFFCSSCFFTNMMCIVLQMIFLRLPLFFSLVRLAISIIDGALHC